MRARWRRRERGEWDAAREGARAHLAPYPLPAHARSSAHAAVLAVVLLMGCGSSGSTRPIAEPVDHAANAEALAAQYQLQLLVPDGYSVTAPVDRNGLRSDITLTSDDGHIEVWMWLWGMGEGLPAGTPEAVFPSFAATAALNMSMPAGDEAMPANPTESLRGFERMGPEVAAELGASEAVSGAFVVGKRTSDRHCCGLLLAQHLAGKGIIFSVALIDVYSETLTTEGISVLPSLRFQ